MELKKIDVRDLKDICPLNQIIFKDEIVYESEYIERFCKLNQGFVLKTHDTKLPVGYVIYGMVQYEGARAFTVISIGVLNKYRGKGYGKLLLNVVLDDYPDRDIFLHVRASNKIARKMYESLGFVVNDLVKDYYYQLNDDAYHMVRRAKIQ